MKSEIEEQIDARLTPYNIIMDTISITDFQFSDQFVQAVEAKVQANSVHSRLKMNYEEYKSKPNKLKLEH